MGSGLAWGYASNALDQLLAQRKLEALQEADRQEKIRQFNVGAQERARAHDLNLQIHQNTLNQQAEQRQQAEADKTAAAQSKFFEGMTPTDETGTLRTISSQTAAPALLGPYSGQVQRTIPMNDQGLPSGAADVFQATPGRQWIEKRQEAADKLALANAAREAKPQPKPDVLLDPTTGRVVSALPTGAGTHVAPHPPAQTPHYTVQPEYDTRGNPTGGQFRVNSLTGEISRAVTPEGGARTKPGVTAQTQAMMEGATMLAPHIASAGKQAEALNEAGLFGPFMSRVREKAAAMGTLRGLGSDNPAAQQQAMADLGTAIESDPALASDRLTGRFATTMGLLMTGAARVHGGSRGGGSPQMLEHFKSLLTSSSTLPMFLGRLDALGDFMKTYAAGPTAAPPGESSSSPLPSPRVRTYNPTTGRVE